MIYFLILFLTFFNFLITKENFFNNKISNPQNIHYGYVPRLGGLSIIFFHLFIDDNFTFVLIFLPLLIISMYEDISNKGMILLRLFFTFISSILFCLFYGTITQIETPILSTLMQNNFFAIAFTSLAIASITQGFNLIDGINGQSALSFIAIIISLCLYEFNLANIDEGKYYLYIIAACVPFLLFNFPYGRLFLGDHGAYFLGFLSACLVIIFFNSHLDLYSWNAILILLYPIFEIIFTIGRRFFKKLHIFLPDNLHLHSLSYFFINKKIKKSNSFCNSLCSVLLSPFYFYGPLAFVIANDDLSLIFLNLIVYIFIYIMLYKYFLSFKNTYD